MKKKYILLFIVLVVGFIFVYRNKVFERELINHRSAIFLQTDIEEMTYTFSVTVEPPEEDKRAEAIGNFTDNTFCWEDYEKPFMVESPLDNEEELNLALYYNYIPHPEREATDFVGDLLLGIVHYPEKAEKYSAILTPSSMAAWGNFQWIYANPQEYYRKIFTIEEEELEPGYILYTSRVCIPIVYYQSYNETWYQALDRSFAEGVDEAFLKNAVGNANAKDVAIKIIWVYEQETGRVQIVKLSYQDMKNLPEAEKKAQMEMEAGKYIYQNFNDFEYEYIDYADRDAIESLRQAYSKIDFSWKFPKGNSEKRGLYVEKYYEFLNDKIMYVEPQTGELCCFNEAFKNEYKGKVKENTFWLFDINEDGEPELGIAGWYYPRCEYIFQYNEESDTVSLWRDVAAYSIIGSKAISWNLDGNCFSLYRLDENAEEIFSVFFYFEDYYGETVYMVGYPWYLDKEPKLPEAVKEQAFYDISNDCYLFRVTEELFDELSRLYFKMLEEADKGIEEVQYTYDELFGACK